MVKLHKTDGGRQSSGYTCENKDCTVRSKAHLGQPDTVETRQRKSLAQQHRWAKQEAR